jgi:hypothetical protein
MPSKKGKKGKKDEVTLAKPEPVDGDDRELAMLWDKVGAVGPNPFAPPSHRNMYVTASCAVPSGPLTGATAIPVAPRGASWVIVPPGASSDLSSPGRGENTTPGRESSRIEAVTERLTSTSHRPTPAEQLVPASALNARISAASLGYNSVGVVPPRHVAQASRVAHVTLACESGFLNAEHEQHLATTEVNDLRGAVTAEVHRFSQDRDAVSSDIKVLEKVKGDEDADHNATLLLQHSAFSTEKYRLENDLQVLAEDRPRVDTLLREKRDTLNAISEVNALIDQIAAAHVIDVKELGQALAVKRQRLEQTMTNKLKRTVEEMATLTADQHAARRERAEQERERLAAELASAEKQTRILVGRSRRLTNVTDMLRRDVALESERRTFLSVKNATLARGLQQLVTELEGLEKQFATQASSRTSGVSGANGTVSIPDDAIALANVVDQQYEIILQLRHDLMALKRETADASLQLRDKQRTLMQPDAAASGSLLAIESSPFPQTSRELVPANPAMHTFGLAHHEAHAALVRATVIQSVGDMERGFVNAGRKLEDVTTEERDALVDYLVKRVNNAALGLSQPKASSTTLIPRPPVQALAQTR